MSQPSFTLRPAVLGDYGQLCALWEVLDEEHRRALPHVFLAPIGPRRTYEYVQATIDGPDSTIFVANAETERLLGFTTVFVRRQAEISVRAARVIAEIDNMVVARDARRRGIARALVEAASIWCKARDISGLELSVHDFNESALAFYRAMGFVPTVHRLSRKT